MNRHIRKRKPVSHKRLKKNNRGSIILPSGETITKKEQAKFISSVNAFNQKRGRRIDALNKTNAKAGIDYSQFGISNDFAYTRKSKSYNQFKTKSEFKEFLKNVDRLKSKAFEKTLAKTYKENFISSLKTEYGSFSDEAVKKVQEIDDLEFRRMIEQGEIEAIDFVYFDPDDEKLNIIEQQLGIERDDDKFYEQAIQHNKEHKKYERAKIRHGQATKRKSHSKK